MTRGVSLPPCGVPKRAADGRQPVGTVNHAREVIPVALGTRNPFHRHKHETTDEHAVVGDRTATGPVRDDAAARDRFGGVNWGAAFFGWLVAIAMTVLLSAIVGAVATAVGESLDITQTQAESRATTIGLAAAIAVVVVMAIAYYLGGYVAGRMSRFDGGRQGSATWLIGLVVTILAVLAGWVFGEQYNILDRVDLAQIPIPTDTATFGGVLTGIVMLAVTLLAAMTGGAAGHRYHNKVDRAVWH